MVHLTGVSGEEIENEMSDQGNFFTISGIKYKKAAAEREHVSKVVNKSSFRVNNSTCEECR